MNIDVVVHDEINHKEFSYEFCYNENTKISDLLKESPMKQAIIVNKDKSIIYNVDFYYHNDILYWDEHPVNLYIIDFLSKYPIFKNGIHIVVFEGGLGAAGDFIEFVEVIYDTVNNFIIENPLVCIVAGELLDNVRKWAKSKKCRHFDSFKNSMYEKGIWDINDVKKALSIADDDLIVPLMLSLGYKFDSGERKFILVRKID